jgi:hypothetical protein
MKVNKLFRYIWRFNAVVILVIGILALTCAIGAFVIFVRNWSERPRYGFLVEDPNQSSAEKVLRLGYFYRVEGTPYVRAELASDREPSPLESSGGWRQVRNHLFYNMETRQSHWLFPTHGQVVADTREIVENMSVPPSGSVRALVYLVADNGTEKDPPRSPKEPSALAVSDPTGIRYVVLAQDVTHIISIELLNQDTAVIFYTSADTVHAIELSVPDLRIVGRHDFASTNPGVIRWQT